MDLIRHFGNILAQALQKPEKSGAICGFMRLALKKEYGEEGITKITSVKLNHVLQGELKTKLAILKIDTLDTAIASTIKEVTKNQSLFTMNTA